MGTLAGLGMATQETCMPVSAAQPATLLVMYTYCYVAVLQTGRGLLTWPGGNTPGPDGSC